MQQQISVVALGIADLARSRRFYVEGFGWTPVFENEEIVFYQMNGFVLGTWLSEKLNEDMKGAGRSGASSFALAHNVGSQAEVELVLDRLVMAGGTLMRPADAPPHGGYRGYVADPDGHAWEIAFNPAWAIDERGLVTFGI
ncbi:MAG: VOC family protein [Sphingobium sp.]|nr:VOC family protein [Sphingobium sp.]